jgi:Mrp family chromosome partitioning ATPase
MPGGNLGVVVAHEDRAVIEQIAGVLEAVPGMFVAATSLEAARAGHVVVAGGEVLVTARHVQQPLVALASDDPVRAARAALAAGARELIRWPDESDRLPAAILRAAAVDHEPRGDGVVIAVAGARGGVGTSSVVAMLGASLGDCLVIDLDTVSAGQRAFAPAGEVRTVHDLLSSLADLSPDGLVSALAPHAGGARALHARPSGSEPSVPQLNGLLRAARGGARFVVLDCGRGSTETAREAAAAADIRVIVAADDVASIRGVQRLLEQGFARPCIVLRRERHRGISRRDLEAAFGRRIDAVFRTDRRLARAIDLGTLPSRWSKSLSRLASALGQVHD